MFNDDCHDCTWNLRALYRAMLDRMPDTSMDDDVVPGGDIRVQGNSWLRSAFKRSSLKQVPRETQLRLAMGKVVAKRKLGALTQSDLNFFFGLPVCNFCLNLMDYFLGYVNHSLPGKHLTDDAREEWIRQQVCWHD